MTDDKPMTTGEKFETVFVLFFLYAIGGSIVFTAMIGGGAISDESTTWAEYFGVMLLWPLFAIKYLFIGLYLVLSTGWGLLV